MSTLYLLRHAHAGNPDRWTADDDLRPLSDKGRRQAESVARLMIAAGEAPDLLITSPRVRAAETARIVGRATSAAVVTDTRLAGPLDAAILADILATVGPAECPCLVGHDPALSSLLGELIGLPDVPMRKGALARIDFADQPRAGEGVLRFLVPPELLAGH